MRTAIFSPNVDKKTSIPAIHQPVADYLTSTIES
jgi:hypothetical protein